MAYDSFMDRLLYRLVKKHVAGTTMNSALKKAKELNNKDFHASITFLSNSVDSKSKARYISSTYQELARQISRKGIRASIQVPLAQLFPEISGTEDYDNLRNIISTANRAGVFVWIEIRENDGLRLESIVDMKGYGIALSSKDIDKCLAECQNVKAIKIMFSDTDTATDASQHMLARIKKISKTAGNIVLFSAPGSLINKSLTDPDLRKNVIFEFKLGQKATSSKKLSKRKSRISTYLPFGKDWHAYAMNNVPEGYVRFITSKLLSDEDDENGA